eukprot:879541-Prorocentrum_minimum.AAC.1
MTGGSGGLDPDRQRQLASEHRHLDLLAQARQHLRGGGGDGAHGHPPREALAGVFAPLPDGQLQVPLVLRVGGGLRGRGR